MSISSKAKTLFWYLSKPRYYPELVKLIRLKLSNDKREHTIAEATAWCREKAIPIEMAIEKLTKKNNAPSLETLYPEVYQQALHRQATCPVKMGGPGAIDLLYHLCEHIQAQKVIETGVAYGWSSLAILLSLSKHNGHLYSNDLPYAKLNNDDYVGYVVPEQLKKNWELIRLPDKTGIKQAIDKAGTIDLCHYDSDKSYTGRQFAYPLLWAALRQGGIFISDDIQDNFGFRDFCDKNNLTSIITGFDGKYIGIICK